MINLGVVEEVNEFIKKKKGNFTHPLHKAIGLSIFENYLNGTYQKMMLFLYLCVILEDMLNDN